MTNPTPEQIESELREWIEGNRSWADQHHGHPDSIELTARADEASIRLLIARLDAANALVAAAGVTPQEPEGCRCTVHSEDHGGGYFEWMLEPEPDCPEHGAGIAAESEDHAATVTGEASVQIHEQVRRVVERAMSESWSDQAEYEALPEVAATRIVQRFALAAPIQVDEAKLADVLSSNANLEDETGTTIKLDTALRVVSELLGGGER